jgi:cytoskeletal protein CcmA (bactofilin family)
MSETQKANKTVLGPDCRISGELALDNDAVIMGQFKGVLRISGVLELTDSAEVAGTIVAGVVRMAGAAEADIAAEGGVELLPGAHVQGQIYTSRLNIIDGASFQGEVTVGPKAMQAAGNLLQQQEQAFDHSAPAGNGHDQAAPEHDFAADRETPYTGEQDEHDQPIEDSPVKTVASNVNSILQRRRPKMLTPTPRINRLMSNGVRGNGQ